MIDQAFCDFLEYELTKALPLLNDEAVNGFWCDGVLHSEPANAYSKKFVNDRRTVKLKAFIGKNGQTEYELTLRFGSKALSKYARDIDIKDCLPVTDPSKWLSIDIYSNTIELQLD